MKKTSSLYLTFCAAFIVMSIMFGTIYAVGQQSLRQSANDPQIQLAEDAAAALSAGTEPRTTIGSGNVDMQTSLAPFVVVYDLSGTPVAGTGYLNGKLPAVPIGVLQAAAGKEYHSVIWQPQGDVRIAAVSVRAKTANYYVLSGRNFKQVKTRENRIFLLSVAGWLASVGALIAVALLRKCFVKAK